MYAITGVTGHVGSATARELLARGMEVRAVVRDPAKRGSWEEQGAEVAVADSRRSGSTGAGAAGQRGAFIMMPTFETADDAEHRRLADSIAGAVADSGVPHVVLLSSIGAELVDGTGPIRWLHHLEDGLSRTGAVVSVIRSWHFQEKVEDSARRRARGRHLPGLRRGRRRPHADGGHARHRQGSPRRRSWHHRGSEVIDLHGPEYTEREVADQLAATLGKPLEVLAVPRAGWVDAMLEAGLPAPFARELAALYGAAEDGVFRSCGDRQVLCTTPIGETLQHIVAGARLPAA